MLTITTLGGVSIMLDNAPVSGLASRKAEALLIYLACMPGQHTREGLADLLWDGVPNARGNLSVLLTSLRAQLGDCLVISRQTIAFNTATPHEVDAIAFEVCCMAQSVDDMEACLSRYSGGFLHGFTLRDAPRFEDWAAQTSERLHELAAGVRQRLMGAYLDRHDDALALRQAEALLQSDALDEAAHHGAMLALARMGRRTAALAQYQACCDALKVELNAVPSAETEALHQRIRRGEVDSTLPTQSPSEPALTLQSTVRNAPFVPTSFVGRDAELAHVTRQMASERCRLLTLIGPGGMGKTRLALEAAMWLAGELPHGCAFVPLAALGSAQMVAGAIADALGIALPGKRAPETELLSHLQDKRVLLVLDNAEHLAGLADVAQTLLEGAPHLKLLVTSREPLHLRAEWLFDVQGLHFPGDSIDTAPFSSFSAVRLFAECASRAQAGFAINEDNAGDVVRICQQLDGLPLGIELAAASVRQQTPADIADALARDLSVLATPMRDVPARHRSLRAVFAHSWQLLSDEQRDALRQMAVFRGTFSVEAACAVCSKDEATIVTLLEALVSKSLLRHAAGDRYDAHEMVRQFAAEQLHADAAQAKTASARHADFFFDGLRAIEGDLHGGKPNVASARLRIDLDNVRQAWAWAVQQADAAKLAGGARALAEFYELSGLHREGEGMMAQGMDALFTHAPAAAGVLLVERMRFLNHLGQLETAKDAGPCALAVAGDDALRAAIHLRWGEAHLLQGDWPAAREHLDMALRLAQTAHSPRIEMDSLRNIAFIVKEQGDVPAAREMFDRVLRIAHATGDKRMEATILNNLATLSADSSDYLAGMKYREQSLALSRVIGDRLSEARALSSLGTDAWEIGDFDRCITLYQASIAIDREMGNTRSEGVTLMNLGLAFLYLGDFARAKAHIEKALAIRRAINDRRGEGYALAFMGLLWHQLGEQETALVACRESLRIVSALGVKSIEAGAWYYLGHVLLALGRAQDAVDAYRSALEIRRTLTEHSLTIDTLVALAVAEATRGEHDSAHAHIEEVLAYITEKPALHGCEMPAAVYWMGYRALRLLNDARAAQVLAGGRMQLLAQAERIADAGLRRMFIEEVAAHRDLLRESSFLTECTE